MSKKTNSLASSTKKMTTVSIIALALFIAFVGFTGFSVFNISGLISRASYSNKDGVPTLWDGATFSSPVSINTEVKSAGDHLSYLAIIENKSMDGELYLTDLASRVSDSKHVGFINFDPSSLGYSYSGNDTAWTLIDGLNKDGTYQISKAIRIGPANSSSNRLYIRYDLSPENGNVTDKISFRLKNSAGNYSVATSESSIAYEQTSSEIVAVENNRKDDDSGESAFAEPLGVFSESSNLSAISTSAIAMATISPESITASTIIIIAVLGLFVGSMVAFLVIKNHHSSRKAKK